MSWIFECFGCLNGCQSQDGRFKKFLGKLESFETLTLISPVAESISSLLEMGEKCLRKVYPQFLSPVLSLYRQLSPSWLKIHNMLTHEKITSILTYREYQVALTVVGGLTNKECCYPSIRS
ncbi:MAG: hypothetical protein U9N62_10510 [Thermotogota bacterium]|nr:hypothetical protein [Thermotogota bacterium]